MYFPTFFLTEEANFISMTYDSSSYVLVLIYAIFLLSSLNVLEASKGLYISQLRSIDLGWNNERL